MQRKAELPKKTQRTRQYVSIFWAIPTPRCALQRDFEQVLKAAAF